MRTEVLLMIVDSWKVESEGSKFDSDGRELKRKERERAE
jgi:hypothetical protein